ncbi:MAG: choice-of-anchor G family protein, partial [Microbacterium sp.]
MTKTNRTPAGAGRSGKLSRLRAMLAGLATTSVVVAAGAFGAVGANAATIDDSEALGATIVADLATGDVLDTTNALTGYPSDPGPVNTPLDVDALSALEIDLGGGLVIPLVSTTAGDGGLLDLGEVGALSSYASSPSPVTSTASAGAVGGDGAIDIDPDDTGDYGPAVVDLTSLLAQLDLDALTDDIVDELSLEIGAAASTASETSGTVTSDYVVAGADINLHSPLVGGLGTTVVDSVEGVGDTVDAAVGDGGVVQVALDGLSTTINSTLSALGLVDLDSLSVQITGVDDALSALANTIVTEPLIDGTTEDDSIVIIDLASGTVRVNLENAVDGGLNGQPANTEVLSSGTITNITTAIADALGTLTSKVTTGVEGVLNNATVHVEADVTAGLTLPIVGTEVDVATIALTIDGTLAQFTGVDATDPVIDTSVTLLDGASNPAISALVQPLIDSVVGVLVDTIAPLILDTLGGVLSELVDDIGEGLADTLGSAIDPVVEGLSGVFEVLNQVVTLLVNEQFVDGTYYLETPAFTVNAVSLGLLPTTVGGAGLVNVDLASSTVRALDEYQTELTADPSSVEPGGVVTLTGSGFEPGETVTVEFPDGTTQEVTATGTGELPAGITYTVPDDAEDGDVLTFTATGATSDTPAEATSTVTVEQVWDTTLTTDPTSVEPGDDVTLTGSGFEPGETVTIVPSDGGDPITVTADDDGNITATYTVPDDAEPGDLTFTATGDTSDTPAEATVTV